MQYKPLHDNVVVKFIKQDQKTAGGILLPGSEKEKPSVGEVVAIGSGKWDDGHVRPMTVKVGDKVIFKTYAPNEIPNEEELVLVSESDILAIIS